MTALLSLDEHSLYKNVSSEHKSFCYAPTHASSSLLAFKFEISMSLARDISLLASSIPSSGENKNNMIMHRSHLKGL